MTRHLADHAHGRPPKDLLRIYAEVEHRLGLRDDLRLNVLYRRRPRVMSRARAMQFLRIARGRFS